MSSLTCAVKQSMVCPPSQTAPDTREATFFFAADFAGFDGHFPGDPMLPGIAQIMAVVFTAGSCDRSRILEIRRSKFLSMVRPGETMHVRTQSTPAQAGVVVVAECTTANGICAHIKLVLANI